MRYLLNKLRQQAFKPTLIQGKSINQAYNKVAVFDQTEIPHGNTLQLSPETLYRLSSKADVLNNLIDVLKRLDQDIYTQFTKHYYSTGLKKFGDSWGFCDLLSMLYATSHVLKPENYLEIGVRRGRSLAMAVSAHPHINIYGFDLWIENYAGVANPGPKFVSKELKKLKHRGKLELTSGDSRETVPLFLQNNPDLFFDIITVDGDHSREGARIDIENVLPRLKIGGVLLFDDICHPLHKDLNELWDDLFIDNENFTYQKYTELGNGIAFAVRKN